jgi:hypothetical protein
MEKDNKNGRSPDFSGEGVAVWTNIDKNNNPYLSIKLVGHNTICAFKVHEKKEPKKEEVGVNSPSPVLPTEVERKILNELGMPINGGGL